MEHTPGGDPTLSTAHAPSASGSTHHVSTPAASAPPASEGLLDLMFESAADGLVVGSPDGVILRANAAFASLLGMQPPELTGRTDAELTHPDDRGQTLLALRGLAAHRHQHVA